MKISVAALVQRSEHLNVFNWIGLGFLLSKCFSKLKACSGVFKCITCPLPGLAALWRGRVRRGVVIAGGLHARGFALELLPR